MSIQNTVGYAVGNVLASQCLVYTDATTRFCDKRLLVLLLRELFPKVAAPAPATTLAARGEAEAPAKFLLLLRAMDPEFTQRFAGLWTESKPRPLLDAGRTVNPWADFTTAVTADVITAAVCLLCPPRPASERHCQDLAV